MCPRSDRVRCWEYSSGRCLLEVREHDVVPLPALVLRDQEPVVEGARQVVIQHVDHKVIEVGVELLHRLVIVEIMSHL